MMTFLIQGNYVIKIMTKMTVLTHLYHKKGIIPRLFYHKYASAARYALSCHNDPEFGGAL